MLLVPPPFFPVKVWQTASTGFLDPDSGASVALSGSQQGWSNTGNIVSENGSLASTSGQLNAGSNYSDWLVATDFDVSLPAGAEILGIEVKYKCRPAALFVHNCRDHALQLFLAGAPIGTDQKSASNWASSGTQTLMFETRGGSSNLWGYALTKANVETTTFGFGMSVERVAGGNGTPQPQVDVMQMNVHYRY